MQLAPPLTLFNCAATRRSGGRVTLRRSYDPYGNSLTSSGIGASSYGFTGEWTDNTGLVYLRARYYAPGQGRFTTRDTWPGEYERPLSLNRWMYVEGNPINLIDPFGYLGVLPGDGDPQKECETLGWSGLAMYLFCIPAQQGDLAGTLALYKAISSGFNVRGHTVAGELLRHFVYGNGESVTLDPQWYLSAPAAREKRDQHFWTFVANFLQPAAAKCNTHIFTSWKSLRNEDPDNPFTIHGGSTDVGFATGRTFIDPTFSATIINTGSGYLATIDAYYSVEDEYNFDPNKVGKLENFKVAEFFGVGDEPHRWIFENLKPHGYANDFDVNILWKETTVINGPIIGYPIDFLFPVDQLQEVISTAWGGY